MPDADPTKPTWSNPMLIREALEVLFYAGDPEACDAFNALMKLSKEGLECDVHVSWPEDRECRPVRTGEPTMHLAPLWKGTSHAS